MLKAQIQETEKRTQAMIDQQQKEAFERLQKRMAEDQAAKQRYLDGERKYKETMKQSENMYAREREKFVQEAAKLDPDMAMYKERVDLMKTTERQWGEIKEQLRVMQVAGHYAHQPF